jgi:hypothetical protein
VRVNPPADHQESVPDDPTMAASMNAPLAWQPFNTGGS